MADLLKRLQISEQQYGVGMENNPFKDASPDECMNVCFGGGGGRSPPPPPPQTVTQQTSNIPEYFQPYLERLFERAEAVTTEPFQRYEGQRLAETTPEQKAAYAGVQDMVGGYKPYIATADVLTSQAAQQSTDPMAVASRMNPYQQSVIDIQKREALRDAEKLQQQIGASAVGAGAFGGSRQALQETELARQTGQRLADIQAVGSQQAYQQALNQLAADRAASLAAGQQFAGLGTTQQQLGLAGLGALETVGQTKQAQQQRPLDIAYEDFARETTFPSQQVQQMSSVLRGFNLPTSTYATTQTQQAQPGFGQQLLGYGSGALGLYGAGKTFGLFAGGGDVNPGLKALAKEAPEAVENMGYDPDEVANAYVGGRMNFQGQGPSFVPSPFSPMAGGSGYFSTPQPSPKSNLTNISTPSAGSNLLGSFVPEDEIASMPNANLSRFFGVQSLQDIRDLRERIKDLDKKGEGDTDKVREILEGVQKAKQEKLDKDKEKKGYEALMEGIPIASKVLGADPSQNLGATFFGALSESMPRIQELAGEINDLPIAEQELALETELAKLELSDKERARVKEGIQLEIAGMAEETKLLKEMAASANLDLDSFYTYSETQKVIDDAVGLAAGQYPNLKKQVNKLRNNAIAQTIQYAQTKNVKNSNLLKNYYHTTLANLVKKSNLANMIPGGSFGANQKTKGSSSVSFFEKSNLDPDNE